MTTMMTRRVFCLLTFLLSVACVSAVVEGTTSQSPQPSLPSQPTALVPGAAAAASLGQFLQSSQPTALGATGLEQETNPHTVGQPGVSGLVPPLGTGPVPSPPLLTPSRLPLPQPGSVVVDPVASACAGGTYQELMECLRKHEGTNPPTARNGTAAPPITHPLQPGKGVVGTGGATPEDSKQSEPSNATAENNSNRESSGTESSPSTSAETSVTPSQNNEESKGPETEKAGNEITSSEGNSSSSQGDSRNTDTNTNTTNSIPTVPEISTNNIMPNLKGDADSSSSSMSSVWMRVPLLIVVTLACILVC
ncbi:uncharacterized protein TM35_000113030 [Trypanosoma theileri]|uniref:Mucin TcMUCII n=1 Tax=Trypanosoma theileri TaxID=67003 RepID=A0A1X0NZX8_9TRYP|nr:uncharacterized protein TM35_000113030 [Trypanosoma theileri]ORC89769.1 hypothetical protein TM35_000113030 [Trypanosoma theileri]